MSTKGIIFSAPMVRALLAGTKTQTRRLCAWANNPNSPQLTYIVACDEPGWFGDEEGEVQFQAPYAPGDRLYVREALYLDDLCIPPFIYSADEQRIQWRNREQVAWLNQYPRQKVPSIHMPRWASRLWLDVTEVRVQRLQDITTADVLAEGAPLDSNHRDGTQDSSNPYMCVGEHPWTTQSPHAWYHRLWDTLHTKPGERWEDNPWIVAVSFTVHHGNVDGATV